MKSFDLLKFDNHINYLIILQHALKYQYIK